MICRADRLFILLLVIFILTLPGQGQDSLLVDPILPDSILFDPALPDSLQIAPADTGLAESDEEGLDTTITYAAKSIEFFVEKKQTLLTGDAQVTYKGMTLKAARITVAWDEDLIIAEGLPDTVWADSAQTEIDSITVLGQPVFTEGSEEIRGQKMTYNLKSRRGKILEGRTGLADGYYWGENIKKDSSEVLFVGPGSFTSCSHEHPHYEFRASQMKLIKGDKVVAKPVILYFGEVPVMAIPYGMFPSRRGRHSGLIIPTYGESGSQGRFLRHLGYYWATNDYTDVEGTLDYYEESGFLFHGLGQYNWRYHLSGSVAGSYTHRNFGSSKVRRWELRWGHNQEIDPDTQLRIDANIISDGSYYQDYSFNLNEQLSQTLRSDATLTHSFPGTKNSISANVHHDQNLRTEEITQTIPRISFRRGQSTLIPAPEKDPDDTTEVETKWYHNIYYNYSNEYLHKRVLDEVVSGGDTSLVQDRRSAMKHNIGLNSPQKVLKYVSLNPSISYREDWFDESYDYNDDPAGVKDIGFASRRTFDAALATSTKLYGYWVNPFPGVQAIRHTMTPNVSFSYRPDFSDPAWGYYQEVENESGETELKDRFYGSLYGATSKGEQLALNFSLSNLFQMKYGEGEEEQKRDLFTLTLSSSYNFAADSLRFSPLRSSFRASPIQRNSAVGPLESLSFDLSASHSFYKYGPSGQYDEYYFDPEAGKILRLTSFDISSTMNLSLGKLVHEPEKISEDEADIDSEFGIAPDESEVEPPAQPPPVDLPLQEGWFMGQVPWDLDLSFHYTTNRSNPANPTETFWMNARIDASITQNWQIGYNTRIDLVEHRVISAGLTIYRDLHCWEAQLIWNPLGITQGYYVKVNVKMPQLQDVKVEQRRGQGSFMGF